MDGSNTCVAQKILFLFLVSFAISNVNFAASLLKEKIILFSGSLSISKMFAVLNPKSEHFFRKPVESAIIDGSFGPKSVVIVVEGDYAL
jgi:hypothetical protein